MRRLICCTHRGCLLWLLLQCYWMKEEGMDGLEGMCVVCAQQERRDDSDCTRPHPLRRSPLGCARVSLHINGI